MAFSIGVVIAAARSASRAGGLDGVDDLLPSLEEMHAEIVNLAKREKPPSEDLV